MSTGSFGFKKGFKAMLGVMASVVLAAGAASAMTLDQVQPNTGSFLGGTPIELTGNFSVTFNTGPAAASYSVVFTPDGSTQPERTAVVTASSTSSISAITPNVGAAGAFNVFVRATNNVQSVVSNARPFTFVNTGETTVQAAARTLNDNFNFADQDNDGRISPAEAAALGIDAQTFAQLDTNGDGFISQEELNAALAPDTFCGRLQELLGNLTLIGILAILLSIWENIRHGILRVLHPFPGNPNP